MIRTFYYWFNILPKLFFLFEDRVITNRTDTLFTKPCGSQNTRFYQGFIKKLKLLNIQNSTLK